MPLKILVPTDFSKHSKVAVSYAANLALALEAELKLFHTVYIDAPPRADMAVKAISIEKALSQTANHDCLVFEKALKAEFPTLSNISHDVINGFPIEEVLQIYTKKHNTDLIVMGTKGASGLEKILIGSNAAAVINKSEVPVIIVPEFARFNFMKKIVYATNLWNLEEEMRILLPLARLFDSEIYILNVVSEKSKVKDDPKAICDELIQKLKYSSISFHSVVSEKIPDAIETFIADIDADLLAMFTHELTFFEKVFNEGITRQMAFHSRIPILSFKRHYK